MTDCSFCRGFRQGYFRPLDCTDPTYLGVLLRCPMCVDTDSAQQGGETDSEPTVSGAGVPSGLVQRLALVGSTTVAGEFPGDRATRDRVKHAGHRRTGGGVA